MIIPYKTPNFDLCGKAIRNKKTKDVVTVICVTSDNRYRTIDCQTSFSAEFLHMRYEALDGSELGEPLI